VKLVEEKKHGIIDGNLVPFAGPLKDNTGALKVAAGGALTHEELMAINWYVDGVDGSVPK
jgi:simple sugar transport system substrate-binding protein